MKHSLKYMTMLVYNIFKQSSQSVSLVQHSGNYKLVSVLPILCLSVQLYYVQSNACPYNCGVGV